MNIKKKNIGIAGDEWIWVYDCEKGRLSPVKVTSLYDRFLTNRYMALAYDAKNNIVRRAMIKSMTRLRHMRLYFKQMRDGRRIKAGRDELLYVYNPGEGPSLRQLVGTRPTGRYIVPRRFDIADFDESDSFGYAFGGGVNESMRLSDDLCYLLGVFGAVVKRQGETMSIRIPAVADKVATFENVRALFKMFGEDIEFAKSKNGNRIICDIDVIRLMDEICSGITNHTSVPFFILSGTQEMQYAWLSGYLKTKLNSKNCYFNVGARDKTIYGIRLLLIMRNVTMRIRNRDKAMTKVYVGAHHSDDFNIKKYVGVDDLHPVRKRSLKEPDGLRLSFVTNMGKDEEGDSFLIDVDKYKNFVTADLFVVHEDVAAIQAKIEAANTYKYANLYIMR